MFPNVQQMTPVKRGHLFTINHTTDYFSTFRGLSTEFLRRCHGAFIFVLSCNDKGSKSLKLLT